MAKAYGPLGVEDFGSWRQIQELDAGGLRSLSSTITTLAQAEGLTAHAYSVAVRMEASG
jgi:histidinol dehydrogenase